MVDFNWTVTPGTLLLAGNLLAMVTGGLYFRKQNTQRLNIENTEKLQNIATSIVDRQDIKITKLEDKIDKDRIKQDETNCELSIVREYLLRDAVWHIQVLNIIESLNGGVVVPPAPILPPRQREYKNDQTDSESTSG